MNDEPSLFGERAFDDAAQEALPIGAPLAARMRPRSLTEFVGQGHVLATGSGLRTALERGNPPSMILWGPPGTGKTTLARLAAAAGDARIALNALELAAEIALARDGESALVKSSDVEEALQRRALRYDKAGDEHYDVISAFIKSVRDSDADAAVYYLARMLEAGEDPLFVARRLVVLSCEDVGLADPHALPLAMAAFQATHAIGMPEALYPLTEATIYLSRAPKSNSGLRAYFGAKDAIDETGALPVPLHLRNAVTGLMRELGYGAGYKYAHDFEKARVDQQHLPDELAGRTFYVPGENERNS